MRSQRIAGDDDDDDAVPRTDLEERESGRRESDVAGLEGYLFGPLGEGGTGKRAKDGKERVSREGLTKTFFCEKRWVALNQC